MVPAMPNCLACKQNAPQKAHLFSRGYQPPSPTRGGDRLRHCIPLLLPSWELAAPNGFLTTTVITYVIWPTFLKERGPSATLGLQVPTVLLTHTGNTIIILAEMVLGRAPICVSHAGFAPLMGVAYIAFSWACNPFLAPKFGAQYL